MFSSHETLEATKQEQERWLQEGVVDEKGRTVLTILYLAVLGLCFVVPIFYYFRLHCEERRLRQLREIEIAAIRQTLEESENENREEARAARRKYREERRAQIIQLFSPVRMFLKKENFPHLLIGGGGDEEPNKTIGIQGDNHELDDDSDVDIEIGQNHTLSNASENSADANQNEMDQEEEEVEVVDKELSESPETIDTATSSSQVENIMQLLDDDSPEKLDDTAKSEDSMDVTQEDNNIHNTGKSIDPEDLNDPNDPDNLFVEIPTPGLPVNTRERESRLVPNLCTICLCNYEIGSDIVWSSNFNCEHAFHFECIEEWIMNQREGPLCPCCRRDFIIDPYDLEGEEKEGSEMTGPNQDSIENLYTSSVEIQDIESQGHNIIDDLYLMTRRVTAAETQSNT